MPERFDSVSAGWGDASRVPVPPPGTLAQALHDRYLKGVGFWGLGIRLKLASPARPVGTAGGQAAPYRGKAPPRLPPQQGYNPIDMSRSPANPPQSKGNDMTPEWPNKTDYTSAVDITTTRVVNINVHVTLDGYHADTEAEYVLNVNGIPIKRMSFHQAQRLGLIEQ